MTLIFWREKNAQFMAFQAFFSYVCNLKRIGELSLFQWSYFDEIRYIFLGV